MRYAEGLRDAGHEVEFAACEGARERVEKRGFTLWPVPDPSEEDDKRAWAMLDAATAEDALQVGIEEVFGGIKSRAALAGVRAAVSEWGPDLIVRESCEFAGLIAGEEADVPTACISILSTASMERHEVNFRTATEALRRHAGRSRDWPVGAEPVFCDFPAALDEVDLIHGAQPTRVAPCGPAQTDTDGSETWLPSGDRPLLYVTFGTVSGRSERAQATYRLALEVVAGLPVDALLTIGPIMDPTLLGTVPENVSVETFVPQTDVFSQAKAVVHHGGSGTLVGALAAGLPQVVIPSFADQPDNAMSVERAGVGVAVLDREAHVLRAAIERVLDDAALEQRAARLAEEMAAMLPMREAVARMEQLAG
ncbi:MAG: glycosyltransferase family 1 protein [Silicimonas sp.]|nr:glycosyltransferase family 1 protein [Silicimonas sp.]